MEPHNAFPRIHPTWTNLDPPYQCRKGLGRWRGGGGDISQAEARLGLCEDKICH